MAGEGDVHVATSATFSGEREGPSHGDDAHADEVATTAFSGGDTGIRRGYETPRLRDLRVPPRVVSFSTSVGPVEVHRAESI
jgi:hypothetical protein